MILWAAVLVGATFLPTEAREIQVKLQAPWAQRTVHPLVEVAEFLAEQSSSDFWKYVDNLCSSSSSMETIDTALSSSTDDSLQNITHLAQAIGVQIVPSNVENILEVSSNLGMYLPAVQFYESLSSSSDAPCGAGNAYVLHYPGGMVSCSHEAPESGGEFNTTSSATLTDETVNMAWNHEYPFGSEKRVTAYTHSEVQVLYGVIGSTSFCGLHAQLR